MPWWIQNYNSKILKVLNILLQVDFNYSLSLLVRIQLFWIVSACVNIFTPSHPHSSPSILPLSFFFSLFLFHEDFPWFSAILPNVPKDCVDYRKSISCLTPSLSLSPNYGEQGSTSKAEIACAHDLTVRTIIISDAFSLPIL